MTQTILKNLKSWLQEKAVDSATQARYFSYYCKRRYALNNIHGWKHKKKEKMGKKKSKFVNHTPADKIERQVKKFHANQMIGVQPLTPNHRKVFEDWQKHKDKHFLIAGSAGTGKTYTAIYLALKAVLNKDYEKVVIIRSSVQAREQGALPGTAEEKMAQFEKPYAAICDELFGHNFGKSYENMKLNGTIQFESTSFLRGTTYNNAIIIVDECQNMSGRELHTIITRVGKNSKIVFLGDVRQDDLRQKKYDVSGFADFMDILNSPNMKKHFCTYEFDHNDIVRSGLVKDYIITRETSFPELDF